MSILELNLVEFNHQLKLVGSCRRYNAFDFKMDYGCGGNTDLRGVDTELFTEDELYQLAADYRCEEISDLNERVIKL